MAQSGHSRVKRLGMASMATWVWLCLPACDVDLGARQPLQGASFGAIVFREACQRVTYSAELAERTAAEEHPLDVSGSGSRALCRGAVAPGSNAAPTVQALFSQRENIILGVDTGLPNQPEDLPTALDGYLRAIHPLQDDGTLKALVLGTAEVLTKSAADAEVVTGLAHLGHLGGIRPAATASGLVRAFATAPGLDEFMQASLPLLDKGGAADSVFAAFLQASSFELGHLEPSGEDSTSHERTPWLLRHLLSATHPDLGTQHHLPIALRDPRGLPLLADIVAPYTLDRGTGLAVADPAGYFLSAAGQRIPYVPPLPEPGTAAVGSRDALGRALRLDGKLLYQYADLDGSLLFGGLAEFQKLLDDAPSRMGGSPRDMLFGMLQGVSLLAGTRALQTKSRGSDSISYQGFDPASSLVLDLFHGLAQLLRFSPSSAGQDLTDILRAARTLLATPAYESPLGRVVRALLGAADAAKLPAYDAAKIPADSTLYDDLVPIIKRLFTVDDGQLAEDLFIAMGDAHVKNLGLIVAQLADERGYFFMRQVNETAGLANLPRSCVPPASEDVNGLLPCGIIGDFGHKPDRSAEDSDVTIDWRAKKTDDARNNRSVLQRLLHLVADANRGRPFCNGRSAQFFLGDFPGECDMFQIDNVARFFLLSMASQALRERSDTYAKPAASFRAAIENGRDCRGVSLDPQAAMKCTKLLQYVPDGASGDRALSGLFNLTGFGRYPDPAPAARAIFMDLSAPAGGGQLTAQQVLFNFVKDTAGRYKVDAADPDNRKFRDGEGIDRLFIDEHNGVLFALEKVHGPANFSDGSANPYSSDNFYDAMRPLVDAFAKHAECAARDAGGTCSQWQNATQILADALTVLHRHYPSLRSQVFQRGFLASYGPAVKPDQAQSYEPLLAKVMDGDLVPAIADLVPILDRLTVDGLAGSRRVLPIAVQLGGFVFGVTGPALFYRDPRKVALRNDGQPAGPVTAYYLVADAFRKKHAIFSRPENQAIKNSWDSARSDAVDVLMKVSAMPDGMGGFTYRFDDPRLRPMGTLLLDFFALRVRAHKSDLGGFSDKLDKEMRDITQGPLFAATLDLGVKLSQDTRVRGATYALLRPILDARNTAARDAVAVAVFDAVQLLLDEADVIALGRGLALALDPESGPIRRGITFMRRGRELEQASELVPAPKQVLVRLLGQLYRVDETGLYPMFRLTDAIAEVNRAHGNAQKIGDFTAADYRAVLQSISGFLTSEERGLLRVIDIVRSRCLLGAMERGCPQPQ